MRFRAISRLAATGIVVVLLVGSDLPGQTFRRGGTEFDALRPLNISAEQLRPIIVTEFLYHGRIAPGGRNVVVVARNGKLVPVRVLQLGPGDFCRLAMAPIHGQSSYEILYGGEPPREDAVPAWTNRDGLLLETRQFKQCNLNRLDSVREAFGSAKPIGADYVARVHHAHNPFSTVPAPFLSRYSGRMHIESAGEYMFWTSSRDCSFLLIDGKLVVSAPGRHGPLRRARPGTGKSVRLSAGVHKFEYYHAATGPRAVMVAAWAINPSGPKPRPTPIPSKVFHTDSIARVEAGPVVMRTVRMAPDFRFKIAGEVPLPDEPLPLVGVSFENASPKGLTLKSRIRWDFGDGQTAETLAPAHVYLCPGLYTVKLAIKRGGRTVETANRIYVDRPKFSPRGKKAHKLDDYLPILETYNPQTLDAVALRQLVLVYQWKSETILAAVAKESKRPDDDQPEQPEGKKKTGRTSKTEEKKKAAELKKQAQASKDEARGWIEKAVATGKAAFLDRSAAKGDEDLLKLARLVAPMARGTLGDSQLALTVWQGAADKIADPRLRAECKIEAADIALSDLVDVRTARPLLEAAAAQFGDQSKGAQASRLQRIRGDCYALEGDGRAARTAYRAAERLCNHTRSHIQRSARRGAHSRSTEQFLKTGEWGRALAEIRLWQDGFPADKIDGYLTLLYARYWTGREKHDQAIALSEQLIAVNPDSPYADQILLLAAQCEEKRGKVDRAIATLESLVKDYPGSPLVPSVRENIKRLRVAN